MCINKQILDNNTLKQEKNNILKRDCGLVKKEQLFISFQIINMKEFKIV